MLVLTALAATLALGAVASPAGAGLTLTDLTVAPDIGRPGDAFTVSGGGCGQPPNNVQAAGHSSGGRFAPRLGRIEFSVSVAVAFPTPTATTTTPDSTGAWSVNFVVPQGTPPGVYEVSATCLQSITKDVSFGRARGGPPAIPYESSTYTVIGDPAAPPPAEAVVGAPRFTG
jgi:hypothetical protein